MRLNGKTALITGGNSGIGLATARAFVQHGAKVAITGRDQATLDEAVRSLGSDVLAFRADLLDPGSNEAAIHSAAEAFGHLDIVVANAGISGNTPVGGTTAEQFERIMTTNVTGVFLTVQAAAPYLRKGGSVILIGSVHAVLGMPAYSAYAASKGAVRSMGRVLASELAPAGVRVNVVVPGATRTPIWTRNDRAPDTLAKMELRLGLSVPSGRISEVEEIANPSIPRFGRCDEHLGQRDRRRWRHDRRSVGRADLSRLNAEAGARLGERPSRPTPLPPPPRRSRP
jgi:NAD(P)-dependent dehydrogenase (short-subunit alcohol dehydrogenase family)